MWSFLHRYLIYSTMGIGYQTPVPVRLIQALSFLSRHYHERVISYQAAPQQSVLTLLTANSVELVYGPDY